MQDRQQISQTPRPILIEMFDQEDVFIGCWSFKMWQEDWPYKDTFYLYEETPYMVEEFQAKYGSDGNGKK